jgi:xylulokinase
MADVKYFAGIDIGTTNIKGSLYSSDGCHVSKASTSYKSFSPKEGFHEQDPNDWVDGFIYILQKLLINASIKENLEAVSISTQGGTLIAVDSDFKPLYRAITWLDRRTPDTLDKNKELLLNNKDFIARTGWEPDCGISLMPLLWLKENISRAFNKIHKILYVNDYVQKKITGEYFQDPSNASITLFYNVKNGTWDEKILKLTGLDKNKFSKVKNPGELVGFLDEGTCKKLNIKKRVKVINGSHDQYCAGLGCGLLSREEILLATGTAWVIFTFLDNLPLSPESFSGIGRFSFKDGSADDKFGLIYSIPSAGMSVKWFAENIMNLASEDNLFKMENENSGKIISIENNIIFHPYLTGSYGPDLDLKKRAGFLNIDISHNYLHLFKAIMEGVGFQLKKVLASLQKKGVKPKEIKMVGGGSKSKVWPKIIADITNTNILIPENRDEDFASKGAAIIAGYGSGIFSSLHEGYKMVKSSFKLIEPDSRKVKFYEDKFKMF